MTHEQFVSHLGTVLRTNVIQATLETVEPYADGTLRGEAGILLLLRTFAALTEYLNLAAARLGVSQEARMHAFVVGLEEGGRLSTLMKSLMQTISGQVH